MEAQKPKVVQQLAKEHTDKYELAQKYYSLLSALNNLKLTEREIQLVAYTAIKGTITYANARTEFCEKYNTTTATINNIVSKLKKVGRSSADIVRLLSIFSMLFIQLQHGEDRQESNDTQRSHSEKDVDRDGGE